MQRSVGRNCWKFWWNGNQQYNDNSLFKVECSSEASEFPAIDSLIIFLVCLDMFSDIFWLLCICAESFEPRKWYQKMRQEATGSCIQNNQKNPGSSNWIPDVKHVYGGYMVPRLMWEYLPSELDSSCALDSIWMSCLYVRMWLSRNSVLTIKDTVVRKLAGCWGITSCKLMRLRKLTPSLRYGRSLLFVYEALF